jgi:hypothetical protein
LIFCATKYKLSRQANARFMFNRIASVATLHERSGNQPLSEAVVLALW